MNVFLLRFEGKAFFYKLASAAAAGAISTATYAVYCGGYAARRGVVE